jgi:hypothetical protein
MVVAMRPRRGEELGADFKIAWEGLTDEEQDDFIAFEARCRSWRSQTDAHPPTSRAFDRGLSPDGHSAFSRRLSAVGVPCNG